MRVSDKELIRALRCSATVHTEEMDCEDCPCYVREEILEDLRDIYGGLDNWGSCDPNGIMRQAADRLEELAALAEAAKDTAGADCKACKQSHPWCGGCCNTCSDPCNASQWCRRAGNG